MTLSESHSDVSLGQNSTNLDVPSTQINVPDNNKLRPQLLKGLFH